MARIILLSLLIASIMTIAIPAMAQDRLKLPQARPTIFGWNYSVSKSSLDGSTNIKMSKESENQQLNSAGFADNAELTIACFNNTTSVYINFSSLIWDAQDVRYKFDDENIKSIRMSPARDGSGLGLWTGGAAIPIIKEMFGKREMVVGFDSFSQRGLEFTFKVGAMMASVGDLARACDWSD